MSDKEKLKAVKLTERQWDHVLIAMENTVEHFARGINAGVKNDFEMTGSHRALARNNEIASAIAGQLNWKTHKGAISTWKMVASVVKPDDDGHEPT